MKCRFMSIIAVNAETNSKNWYWSPQKKLFALNAKAKKFNEWCLPLPFPAAESLRALPVPPAEAVPPPVVPPAANKLKSLFELIWNSKSAYRNPKQILNPNDQISKRLLILSFRILCFYHLKLFRISNFVLRIFSLKVGQVPSHLHFFPQ